MAVSGAVQNIDPAANDDRELTDGFHLVIDALKLNDLTNIYCVPGIPVSDLLRMMQGEGMRVICVPPRVRTPATPPRSPDICSRSRASA